MSSARSHGEARRDGEGLAAPYSTFTSRRSLQPRRSGRSGAFIGVFIDGGDVSTSAVGAAFFGVSNSIAAPSAPHEGEGADAGN